MAMKPLTYENALGIAQLWASAGGGNKIELGALEPLIWKQAPLKVSDLVKGLTDIGSHVAMTTNANVLDEHAEALAEAGLFKLRISWHTTDANLFADLAGGHGNYDRFYGGITLAAESGLKITFNRVLIKGFCNDLDEQLNFISKYGFTLKLYDLIWTPQISSVYDEIYVDWQDVIEAYVLQRTSNIERIDKGLGQTRLRYHLIGGGVVEVKESGRVDRCKFPCNTCEFKKKCLEDFGDYARIDPDLNLYSCYMRRDIGFNLQSYINQGDKGVNFFRSRMSSILQGHISVDDFLQKAVLRLTVVPYCNFNCRVPGTNMTWCMEEPGEYRYPKLKPSMFPVLGGEL